MQAEFIRKCSLCLLKEAEVLPFLQKLRKQHPQIEIALFPAAGSVQIRFQSEAPVDHLVEQVQEEFPTFFYGEGMIEEAVQREFIARKKTLALAESCTGGSIAAKLTSIPHASQYLLGSIVAYSNAWKERFLQVSHSTLQEKGAVSKEAVVEMVQGLWNETEADYAVAISGLAGPGGGSKEMPVGTIYIAIGVRGGKIDAGVIHAPPHRAQAIELSVYLTLGALWRRIVHNTVTFS
jgi:PncC family amidohydrolase